MIEFSGWPFSWQKKKSDKKISRRCARQALGRGECANIRRAKLMEIISLWVVTRQPPLPPQSAEATNTSTQASSALRFCSSIFVAV